MASSTIAKFALGSLFITSVLVPFLLKVEHQRIMIGQPGYIGINISGPFLALDMILWIASAIGFMATYEPESA